MPKFEMFPQPIKAEPPAEAPKKRRKEMPAAPALSPEETGENDEFASMTEDLAESFAEQEKEYKYFDKNNEYLGDVRVTLGELEEIPQLDSKAPKVLGRPLQKLVLIAPDGKEHDVMNELNPRGKKIYVVEKMKDRQTEYHYQPAWGGVEDHIVSPMPETALDLAVLAHEGGHEEQWQSPKLKKMSGLYGESYKAAIDREPMDFDRLRNFLAELEIALPATKKFLEENEGVRHLKSLTEIYDYSKGVLERNEEEIANLIDQRKATGGSPEALKELDRKIYFLRQEAVAAEQQLDMVNKEAARLSVSPEIEVAIAFPMRFMEQDASRRAKAMFKKIEAKTGVALGIDTKIPWQDLPIRGMQGRTCELVVGEGEPEEILAVTSPEEEWERALVLYGIKEPSL